ncbi:MULTISPECIES: TlyA family RNA methyltransferase [Hyphomonas]|uniref:TlyA family rRNA (Cytidine-2'-O)-methyltransferase n=1 Tax=Hyphomonas adhaerens TaxID=81029 RepID=A0A3B9H3Y2_9PROT|nr:MULTISPECIES: TlyA family RNA methyltransferase [Hyphomonas]MBB42059.1 TlyA family rRNA (cytidine-2'-O)-methyltransferase [Hyphomonas sp.]HAE29405.1 TlyA family rRNA (cytidine-2'-O)-methyltransferase [Hyphomonas adhaerens]|tara:strand:- start:5055 stop:5783 length:729 start_codon:yes stop_codon:yes gene_type:complete
MKDRADRLLVTLGLFESRAGARAAIEAGLVRVDGARVAKPAQEISAESLIEADPAHPYVSRGGLKLAHGLEVFGVDPAGRPCLDIGASTGGFTEVLLLNGAAHVTAVDVGRGQLHARIAGEPRVTNYEATDARRLTADMFPDPPTLLVCDASFISLEKLLDVPLSLAAPGADFVGLFKPQFEVGRDHVGKGGIVTDLAAADAAAGRFSDWMTEKGWPIHAWTASPISGGDGNAERLFHAVKA